MESIATTSLLPPRLEPESCQTEEILSLRWNNHLHTFQALLADIKMKNDFSDLTIACNGEFFSVHKLVLSSCSDYFTKIIQSIDCSKPVIVLTDVSCDDLKSLLNYMYLGEVNVLKDSLPSLLKASQALGIKGLTGAASNLKNECIANNGKTNQSEKHSTELVKLSKNLNEDKFHEICEDYSHLYSDSKKRMATDDMIMCNFDDFEMNDIPCKRSKLLSLDPMLPELKFSQDNSVDGVSVVRDNYESTVKEEDVKEKTNSKRQKNKNKRHSSSQSPKETLSLDTLENATKEVTPITLEDLESYAPSDASAQPVNISSLDCSKVKQGVEVCLLQLGNNETGTSSSNIYCVLNNANNVKLKENILIDDNFYDETTLHNPNISNICTVEMSSGEFTPTTSDCIQIAEGTSNLTPEEVSLPTLQEISCQYCSKKFAFSSDLRRHVRSHTGEKPYTCEVCPFKTSQKFNLVRHKKMHKSEEKLEE